MKDVPAWTDGVHVYFNKGVLAKSFIDLGQADNLSLDFSAIADIKGVNYHEIGHMLYSPRMTDQICRKVKNKSNQEHSAFWYAFNVLEDMRAETLIVQLYPKMNDYFTRSVLRYILKNNDEIDFAYLLTASRFGLPTEINAVLKPMFENKYGKDITKALEEISGQYVKTITYTKQRYQSGLDLIERFVYEVIVPMQKNDNRDEMSSAGLPRCINGSQHVANQNAAGRNQIANNEQTQKHSGLMVDGKTQVLDQKDAQYWIDELADDQADSLRKRLSKQTGTLGGQAGSVGGEKLLAHKENAGNEIAEILEKLEKKSMFKNDVEMTKKQISAGINEKIDAEKIHGLSIEPNYISVKPIVRSTYNQIRRLFNKLKHDLEQEWIAYSKKGMFDVLAMCVPNLIEK